MIEKNIDHYRINNMSYNKENQITSTYLSSLSLGQSQVYENMAVIPVFAPSSNGLAYITLTEGLNEEVLTITEVDDKGYVPNLKVINSGDKPVLLLDGEDLAGAKQNRTLNTSILIRAHSETIIPVSCTERDRWSYYDTHNFYDPDLVMSKDIRAKKMAYVSDSLKNDCGYRSDQRRIWDDIDYQAERAKVHSRTGAMRDIYKGKSREIDEYLKEFSYHDGQRGLMVLLNGKVVGMDVFSRPEAYVILHYKLLKSYCMDAILDISTKDSDVPTVETRSFLDKIHQCNEKKFKSIGHGWDHRFESDQVVGSALIFQNVPIHMAFFEVNLHPRGGEASRGRL